MSWSMTLSPGKLGFLHSPYQLLCHSERRRWEGRQERSLKDSSSALVFLSWSFIHSLINFFTNYPCCEPGTVLSSQDVKATVLALTWLLCVCVRGGVGTPTIYYILYIYIYTHTHTHNIYNMYKIYNIHWVGQKVCSGFSVTSYGCYIYTFFLKIFFSVMV